LFCPYRERDAPLSSSVILSLTSTSGEVVCAESPI
jgi:hypothetical protein